MQPVSTKTAHATATPARRGRLSEPLLSGIISGGTFLFMPALGVGVDGFT